MFPAFISSIAALFGLAFGSFLNVCASRMPEDESIVTPGSHCRSCHRILPWHENIPVMSWIILRGRCPACGKQISWRYPIVELAVAFCWTVIAHQASLSLASFHLASADMFETCLAALGNMIVCWLLVLLGTLDAEHLWLPDRLTLGGSALGVAFALVRFGVRWAAPRDAAEILSQMRSHRTELTGDLLSWIFGILVAPSLILFVRWVYKLVRHREGIGLGDAKLMLFLAVWLGLLHTIVAFALGVFFGTVFACFLLLAPRARRDDASWLMNRIPLGTFLSLGGILSALWRGPIVTAYLRANGF